MRTISVVTMLFLPATFIATLFSTSFFDFQAKGDMPVVSPWVWLYVIITVLMTGVIQGAWFLSWRRKDLEIEQALKATLSEEKSPSQEEYEGFRKKREARVIHAK